MILTRTSLQCRECKKEYDTAFKYVCEDCFGPLDVKYNFPTITKDKRKELRKILPYPQDKSRKGEKDIAYQI